MALGLTQSEMNAHAAQMLALLPSEVLTYRRTGESDVEVLGHIYEFTAYQRTVDPTLRAMRRCRLAVNALALPPTQHDVIERADGSVWDVDSVEGGPNRPWYLLTIRQVR